MEEVVSVFKSRPRKYSLQTSRSWDFVNLLEREQHLNGSILQEEEEELLQKANGGEDVIVGVLDSGNLNSKLYTYGICCIYMTTNKPFFAYIILL